MTAQETERVELPGSRPRVRPASTRSAGKAYDRRIRRQEQALGRRLTRTGSPVAAALTRVPFVALVLLLLSGGVVGVLYLNTISDAAGLRASQSRLAQMDLDTRIEAENKLIADKKDPAYLAAQARALGLVPAGDTAIIRIGSDGKPTVIGTPTAVPGPVQAAPAAPVAAPVAAPIAAPVAAPIAAPVAVATPVVHAPVPAKANTPKVAAPKVIPPVVAAPKVIPPKSAVPKVIPPQSAAPKVVPPKPAAPKALPTKSAAPKALPTKSTARTAPRTTTPTSTGVGR